MPKYRDSLPQLNGGMFLTDGGLETVLIFQEGVDLPHFAAYDLVRTGAGRDLLRSYFSRFANIARDRGLGFVLESPTWRASTDWGANLGDSEDDLTHLNREAIRLLVDLRAELENPSSRMVVSGCVGPRGDGYDASFRMTAEEAEAYHGTQIRTFAGTEADMVTAITMNYVAEAVGVTRAAEAAGMPSAISFTVETDGRLPSGRPLPEAITVVDEATGGAPAYYMVNCAHPTHFEDALARGEEWTARVRGIRANASKLSHAELDEAEELDDGNPVELGEDYRRMLAAHRHINVLGGCCGTDHRHVAAIAEACTLA